MDKTSRAPLPSIRGRILSALLAFGFSIVVLVSFAMAVADGWATGLFSLALVLFAVGLLAWHLAGSLTREVRVLARAVEDANAATPPSPVPPASFRADTQETRELARSLGAYATRIRALTASAQEEAEGCRVQVSETGAILSDFMYYMAHVLRTPVNAIRWTVESLKNEESGEVTDEQRELLDKLEYSSVKLASVADELQDAFIVLRGDPLHVRPAACDLARLVDEAAGTWAVALRRKGLKVSWRHPGEDLPALRGDERRLSQVLNVLMDNAVKYSPPGSTISVRAQAVGAKVPEAVQKKWAVPPGVSQSVLVAVSDQGIGIPRGESDSVFRPFFRGEKARELWVDGKGLGLTLARAIVGTHGGQMWFSSRPGKGTTMHFSVPFTERRRVPRAEK